LVNMWHVKTAIVTFLISSILMAADLKVEPSATEISEDDSVSVQFEISQEGNEGESGDIFFDADDFEELNVMRSQGMQSLWINGNFQTKRTLTVTVVLHPKRTGELKIQNIRTTVGNKKLTAPDQTISVLDRDAYAKKFGNGGSLPGYGSAIGRRHPAPRGSNIGARESGGNLLVRTEPSKTKVYKGEQILLTYALYSQVTVASVGAERYPNAPGFLKEEIEMPILKRLQFEPAVLGGKAFKRAVLAQYAIYPVKTGKLTIDPLTTKVNVRSMRGIFDQDDEDIFGMNQFFKALQGQVVTRSSDRVDVEVLPLPTEGQPVDFSGLVGDFTIAISVDKTALKVGEALNVKVKVEGDGHAAILEKLPISWPEQFELYEDKARTLFHKTGRTERTFDFMLIPKTKGQFEVPAIKISMFNPTSARYETRQTKPISIEVIEGSGGLVFHPTKKEQNTGPVLDVRGWMSPDRNRRSVVPWILGTLVFVGGLGLFLWSLLPFILRRNYEIARAKRELFDRIKKRAASLTVGPDGGKAEWGAFLADSEGCLEQAIEIVYRFKPNGLTRPEIRQALTGRQADPGLAQAIEKFLERCENLRFTPAGGINTDGAEIRKELLELLSGIEVDSDKKKGGPNANHPAANNPIH